MVGQPDHKRIAVCNAKGGTGKTFCAINIAAALEQREHDVLLVDLDPQGAATEGIGRRSLWDHQPPTIYDALAGDFDVADSLVFEADEFDIIPSNIDLLNAERLLTVLDVTADLDEGAARDDLLSDVGAYENALEDRTHSAGQLAGVLDRIDGYDFVVIDTPPFFGELFANSVFAARHLVVPSLAETTSQAAVETLYDEIGVLVRDHDIEVDDVAAIINRIDLSTNESDRMIQWLQDVYSGDEGAPIFKIPKRVDAQYSFKEGESILRYEPDSDVSETFREIAEAIESHDFSDVWREE